MTATLTPLGGEVESALTTRPNPPAPEKTLPAARPKTLPELTAECLASPRLGATDLLTELSDKKLLADLLKLSRGASEAVTEHGVTTLYAAFGFLRWYESVESDEPIHSPLVLVPIRFVRESVQAAWTVRAEDDDPATNHCLAELLANDFKLRMPFGPHAEIDTDGLAGLTGYLERVAHVVKSMPRWEVVGDVALGLFNFQKLAMWEDLTKNADRIKAHRLCRAMAGDPDVELRPPAGMVGAAELDERVPPDEVTHILDADSSQHEAVEAVKRGADVVIDGPPGTGKSQTIANAIAELLTAGRTVLFVSEKTAALEVVKRRLDERGLGEFCLELHSHKANKRVVAAELGRCLELGPEAYRDISLEVRQLADDRRRLNAYAAELHRTHAPLDMTAFQAHGELARLAGLPDPSRWSAPDAPERDADFCRRATETLTGLTRCRAVVEDPAAHPWSGCLLTSLTQAGLENVRHHLGRVAAATARLAGGTTLADLALEADAGNVVRLRAAVVFAGAALAVPPVPVGWFSGDPLVAATAAGELHAATSRARGLRGRLDAFSPEAVWALTPDAAAELVGPLSPRRELLTTGATLPARDRVHALRNQAALTAESCVALDRLADAFGRVLPALRLPAKTATAAQARNFAHVAAGLAAGVPVPPSWWDAGRRAELLGVAAQAGQASAAAQTLRAGLAATLAPAAFAVDAGPVVRDALRRSGSFWGRLSPRWRALRQQVAAWYAGPAPGRAGLLAELAALGDFHRHGDYGRMDQR